MGNLRSVLWRLRRSGDGVVADDGRSARARRARRRRRPRPGGARPARVRLARSGAGLARLRWRTPGSLLPDWSDDWVLAERERFRQLRLHALETACGRLVRAGDFGQAVEVCLAAVADEPLRESAQRELINLYLAEGNRIDALRQYEAFRLLIGEELGIEPSRETTRSVAALRSQTLDARRDRAAAQAG